MPSLFIYCRISSVHVTSCHIRVIFFDINGVKIPNLWDKYKIIKALKPLENKGKCRKCGTFALV